MANTPADPRGGQSPVPPRPGGDQTVLAMPLAYRLLVLIGFPVLGLALSLGLPPLARWALDLGTGLPVRPVFWVVGWADRPWKVVVSAAIGLLLGYGVARTALRGAARVTVTDQHLLIEVGDRTQEVGRDTVGAAFLDGKKLVLLDRESRYLVREELEAASRDVEQALRVHGYPWHGADPYADLFRRWEPDSADLPGEVHTVLGARETALRKKADREARDLRGVVQKLGYVVREEGERQYWRPLVRS